MKDGIKREREKKNNKHFISILNESYKMDHSEYVHEIIINFTLTFSPLSDGK